MMTTSASSLSAIARATVAPTLPAPPTTVTFLFMESSAALQRDGPTAPLRHKGHQDHKDHKKPLCGLRGLCGLCARSVTPWRVSVLQVCNHRIGELRRLQLRRAFHLAREVVGHLLLLDRLLDRVLDRVGH